MSPLGLCYDQLMRSNRSNEAYEKAVCKLESICPLGIRLGLRRVRQLLKAMGNPEETFRAIIVGGTNGKGSVAAMVSSILKEGGYRVGRYTSPHLFEYTERMVVGERPVSRERFVEAVRSAERATQRVRRVHPRFQITEFEFLTAMAFWIFSKEKVDIAVLEVGLGGRLDATNVVRPLASIITHVDFDHMDRLGKRLGQIATEKAGIIHRGIPVITACTRPEALRVLVQQAKEKKAPFFHIYKDLGYEFVAHEHLTKYSRIRVWGKQKRYPWLSFPLKGAFQIPNLLCVLALFELLPSLGISLSAIQRGLSKTTWPGRFEIVSKKPLIILDIAHNPSGARGLGETLSLFRLRVVLVLAVQVTKDAKGIVRALAPHADSMIATSVSNIPCTSPRVLSKAAQACGVSTSETSSLHRALKLAVSAFPAICVTGSLYTVSEAKRVLAELGYKKAMC